jgi:hypothetical protein
VTQPAICGPRHIATTVYVNSATALIIAGASVDPDDGAKEFHAMADDTRRLTIDRRSEPRESLDSGYDPYVLSLLPASGEPAIAADRQESSRKDIQAEANEPAPTRHRAALIRESSRRPVRK